MIGIAVLGCGTVGAGVCELLTKNAKQMETALGQPLELCGVLERDGKRTDALGIPKDKVYTDMAKLLLDENIRIVVETMGGVGAALECCMAALGAKKHVVTSNKDLIELHWDALHRCANENGVGLYYEGAVGGGIPIIQALRTSLRANRVQGIVGILNGTSNYILTRMRIDGVDYETALRAAQAHGFAEADPKNDVEGYDAARKLAILSRLCFGVRIGMGDVYTEGITAIDSRDIQTADAMGYALKLLAVARRESGGVTAYVRPAFVPKTHPIAAVDDEFNAIFLQGDAVGNLMFYGKGAGALPTASAVLGDVIVAARDALLGVQTHWTPPAQETELCDDATQSGRYYLRIEVEDLPLVLAGISTALGQNGVSMASLMQRPHPDGHATITIITHATTGRALQCAVEELLAQPQVGRVCALLCLNGEEHK